MTQKFTPGPWTVDETVALGAYGVWTDYATHPGHDGAGYPSQICSMGPTTKSEITREQRDANARLIAAAPELLAALRRILAHECQEMPCMVCAQWARDAIRLTRGEQPKGD